MRCYHCGSEALKNGFAPNGKQKYWCKTCGKASREQPSAKGYSEARKEEMLRAYQERSSLRGLSRTFGVSRTTVTKWLKKSPDAEPA
jgi:transposase-like protein